MQVRKQSEYAVLLSLIHTSEPEKLKRSLLIEESVNEELDVVGLEGLKQTLRANPKFIVK